MLSDRLFLHETKLSLLQASSVKQLSREFWKVVHLVVIEHRARDTRNEFHQRNFDARGCYLDDETFSLLFGALNRLDASKHFCSSSLGGKTALSLSLSLSLGTRIEKFLETGSAGCSPKT